MLRRIFGLKKEEATRGGRKLDNEWFNELHYSPNTIRIIESRIGYGHVTRMGQTKMHKVLVEKPEGM